MKLALLLGLFLFGCAGPYSENQSTISGTVKNLSYSPNTEDLDVGFSVSGNAVFTPTGHSESYNVVLNTDECDLLVINSKKLFKNVKEGSKVDIAVRIRKYVSGKLRCTVQPSQNY